MKLYILGLLFCSVFFGYAQSKAKPITELTGNEISNGIFIDVRTPEEFGTGHLDKATNVNWLGADFTERIAALKIDKDETVYLYCKKGGRSTKAAQQLDSLGYKNVVNLLGGYDAYQENKD
ncbi:hypothetical protein LCGC14_1004530 [marine sediment metagenome]|uniref:Rhodanese-like domain-containing protein n=2 Tax=root TaxID=1 RepID=A0A831QRY0_9FLAO|nr:rhodanese-like domain-containing protein [Pricia antarctica]